MDDSKAKIKIDTPHGSGEDTTIQDINSRLVAMLDEAPSDASAELVVQKSGKRFKGFLKIYSASRKFVGGSTGSGLRDVVNNLFDEVRGQIKTWKRDRYAKLTSSD